MRQVSVFCVVYDAVERHDGVSDHIARFRSRDEADRFASCRRWYGKPCVVREEQVPVRVAARWGLD